MGVKGGGGMAGHGGGPVGTGRRLGGKWWTGREWKEWRGGPVRYAGGGGTGRRLVSSSRGRQDGEGQGHDGGGAARQLD